MSFARLILWHNNTFRQPGVSKISKATASDLPSSADGRHGQSNDAIGWSKFLTTQVMPCLSMSVLIDCPKMLIPDMIEMDTSPFETTSAENR